MYSSVQLESGKTRILSSFSMRELKRFQSSGRWFLGSHWPCESRKEYILSLARDFSSSRRAPPNAALNPPSDSASRRDLVFSKPQHFCVPSENGFAPRSMASSFL